MQSASYKVQIASYKVQIASYMVQITSYRVQIISCRFYNSSYRPDLEAVRAGPSSKMQFKMHSRSDRIKRL